MGPDFVRDAKKLNSTDAKLAPQKLAPNLLFQNNHDGGLLGACHKTRYAMDALSSDYDTDKRHYCPYILLFSRIWCTLGVD